MLQEPGGVAAPRTPGEGACTQLTWVFNALQLALIILDTHPTPVD
jgi:hypothetical protein